MVFEWGIFRQCTQYQFSRFVEYFRINVKNLLNSIWRLNWMLRKHFVATFIWYYECEPGWYLTTMRSNAQTFNWTIFLPNPYKKSNYWWGSRLFYYYFLYYTRYVWYTRTENQHWIQTHLKTRYCDANISHTHTIGVLCCVDLRVPFLLWLIFCHSHSLSVYLFIICCYYGPQNIALRNGKRHLNHKCQHFTVWHRHKYRFFSSSTNFRLIFSITHHDYNGKQNAKGFKFHTYRIKICFNAIIRMNVCSHLYGRTVIVRIYSARKKEHPKEKKISKTKFPFSDNNTQYAYNTTKHKTVFVTWIYTANEFHVQKPNYIGKQTMKLSTEHTKWLKWTKENKVWECRETANKKKTIIMNSEFIVRILFSLFFCVFPFSLLFFSHGVGLELACHCLDDDLLCFFIVEETRAMNIRLM